MTEPSGRVALRSVLRLHHVATSIVDAELKDGFRLRLIDYLTLTALQTSDVGAVALGQLARQLDVHATTISIAVERMESRRLVRRRIDPHDRRATLVTITDDGLALADAATAALERVNFGLPGLSAIQARSLVNLIARIPER
ncbi:MAG TPA: MarR family transcriptional regulator [Mycobacterium sp.]|nr:MarR family transcriptional regulator [Mycobacterium sp.]